MTDEEWKAFCEKQFQEWFESLKNHEQDIGKEQLCEEQKIEEQRSSISQYR
jgi:hypothetical protein